MRYILRFLIAIGLIVLVFILILKAFSGNSSTPKNQPALISYAGTNTVTQLIIDGPVNADQTHQAVKIDVSQFQSEIDIVSGYQGKVVNSKTYLNNQPSYANFLRALEVEGFNKGNTNGNSDPRGYCPLGNRYVYSLYNGSHKIENLWSTSCGGQGTFAGNAPVIRQLFEAQIPDYANLTQNLQLNV